MSDPTADALAAYDALGADYDPEVFWAVAGDLYESTFDPVPYQAAEAVMARCLADLDWTTALDAGCGFGRLGHLLKGVRPHSTYSGFDVSAAQIAACRRRHPDAFLTRCTFADYKPSRTFGVVVSAEVLMHQPADRAQEYIDKLCSWSYGYVVTCDWYEPGHEAEGNAWNVMHDYPALYGDRLIAMYPVQRQCVFVAEAG